MKPYYESKFIKIYHGNFLNVMREFQASSFDCIITDPPYWTLDKHRAIGTTTRLGGHHDPEQRSGWFKTIDEAQLADLIDESYRLLKNNCHAYIMSDGQTLKWILSMVQEREEWKNCKPLVWDKVNQGMGYHYRCRHEFFVMLDKGKNRKLNSLATPDVWTIPMIRNGYPTEKPVALMEIPIVHSTKNGEIILDPFCGGGSTLIAAERNGRNAIGIDLNEEACELAAKRLSSELQLA